MHVKAAVEGTRTNLYASGLEHKQWPKAMKHWTAAANINRISNVTHDTAWMRRNEGDAFKGLRIPFGAKVSYKLPGNTKKDQPKFLPPCRDALFMGWQIAPGAKWHGDYLVMDLEMWLESPDSATVRTVKDLYDVYDRVFPARVAKDFAAQQHLLKTACDKVDIEHRARNVSDAGTQCSLVEPEAPEASAGEPRARTPTADRDESDPPPPGYAWEFGRLTRVIKTTRPPYIWPELWRERSSSKRV